MRLLINQPRLGERVTTNNGNTASRFFSNPDFSSSITNIDKQIIERLQIILQVIS